MKCLDCGYNINLSEADEHEGHEVIEGFFEDTEGEAIDINRGGERKCCTLPSLK